jgi:phosphoglycerate kinase
MPAKRFRSIDDADVADKRVLLRLDLNVPMQQGNVTDATRIERALPTIRALVDRRAKVIVLSHYGRPKGKPVPEMSLRPVAETLAEKLGTTVQFAEDCVGPRAGAAVAALNPGEVLVLENLRFHAGEEKNDAGFIASLGKLGDIYVNDAFSAAHRAHASTEGLAHVLPAYAGPSMMEELTALERALENPERPVMAIVGGAKISTKISVLTNLVSRVDELVIGGAMANTFLAAQGISVGKSLSEPDLADEAHRIIAAADEAGCAVVLPVDAVTAREFAAGAAHATCDVGAVPADSMILDFGPKSVAEIEARLANASTLLWNGPLGAFEIAPFGEATFAVARAAARLTEVGKLVSVAGGGDTVAALNAAGAGGGFTYVSTAGGAFLEWLEGRELPGVAALAKPPSAA